LGTKAEQYKEEIREMEKQNKEILLKGIVG